MRDGAVERETLGSFLLDLAPGEHAAVLSASVPFDDALGVFRVVARAAKEKFVRAGGSGAELVFSHADRAQLEALAQRARSEGHGGVLVAVDAEGSIQESGLDGHRRVEHAIGAAPLPGVRIVCYYGERVAMDAAEDSHTSILRPGASAWP